MLIFVVLALLIFIQGIMISLSLVKYKNGYLQNTYGQLGEDSSKDIFYYVLVSVFNESSIIKETYDYFQKLISRYENIECFFITTEKEEKVFGKNYTREVLERCITDKRFHLIHYPYSIGNKPSQLNYCLEQIKDKNDKLGRKVYVCQYDADSRPSENTFEDLTNIIQKTNARVIQQQTIYNQNYNKLGLYMRMEACFQTRWAYGFERRNQFLSTINFMRKLFMPYAYCVGHGMVVERELLYEIGGYPTPSEDVPFGFKMMLIGEPIYPAITNDVGSVTTKFVDLISQSGNWIKAPLLAIKMYKEVKNYKDISFFRTILFFTKVGFDFLSWIEGMLFFICAVIISVHRTTFLPVLIAYFILFISSAPGIYYVHKKIFEEKSFWERIIILLISPLRYVIRGVGFISFIKQKMFGWYYDVGRKG